MMTTGRLLLASPLLLLAAACNVSTDQQNDQTVLSVDHDALENGVAKAGDVAERAANEAGEAIDQAVPVVQNTAREVGSEAEQAANRAGNAIERVDVDVNVRDANEPQQR